MAIEKSIPELKAWMNENGQLISLPGKYKKKLIAYYYLASKISLGQRYTEAAINELLNQWALFDDPATLRRELYTKRLLNRTNDGRSYWREEELPPLEAFLTQHLEPTAAQTTAAQP